MLHKISSEFITIEKINEIIDKNYKLALSDEAVNRIQKCRDYLDEKVKNTTEPIYGVTTGFGSLCNTIVPEKDLGKLQENLLVSHACGMGEPIPKEVVKLMLLLKIQSLSYGHSGVQLETVQRLIDFFNEGVYPIVFEQGSLGASGDLAPLAHLCLPLIDEGFVNYNDNFCRAKDVNQKFKWDPIRLKSKESLALINGTQFMSAMGIYTLTKGGRLANLGDIIAALSLDAFNARLEPFSKKVHEIRPHDGQAIVAECILELLSDSQMAKQPKKQVQDPYSFRCIPQVHGASRDAMNYVGAVLETEINSVTDNPTIFPDTDEIISAGNFHGQPLALAFDLLSIALAELGNISERRVYQLIDGKHDLPPYLVANPGLNSGFMIPQYTAASIVSENKSLATPSSVDSIPSSQGQEDHVSMGANAVRKSLAIANNLEKILAIELFTAAQAIEFRRPLKTSKTLEDFLKSYRNYVSYIENDTVMSEKMEFSYRFLQLAIIRYFSQDK